jgi:hypothetical protein
VIAWRPISPQEEINLNLLVKLQLCMLTHAVLAFGLAFLNLEYRKTPARATPVPRALIGEIGVLKKRTDETMTTTRLTQLATEWVTGDTLANKL